MFSTRIATQIYAKICFEATLSQKIIEKLSEYLADDDPSKIFILNGFAGTGKTTLISAFVSALKDLNIKTILLAPTGRAAKVLARYSHERALTVHKRIYLERTNAAYESKFSLGPNREQDALFIVDEASMLSNDTTGGALFGSGALLDDLVTYVRSGKRCRLMLVGDNAQLPPVGPRTVRRSIRSSCPATARWSTGRWTRWSVRRPSRASSSTPRWYAACSKRGIYAVPRFRTDFPDIRNLDGGEFLETLQECYDRYGRDEVIVITRSNKRANRYNEGIRRNILGAEEEIESGDMLMVVKNNYHFTERIEECPVGFMANGDIVRLRRLRRFEEFYGFRFANAVLSFPDYDDTEIDCKILLDTIASESPSLTAEESRRLFAEVEQDYLDIKSKIKRLKEIRENPHYNAVQVKFAYAVTCHKAQGGQWRAVFIDRFLFGDEQMTRDRMRWLYTALTRASDRLYLVNFPEEFIE